MTLKSSPYLKLLLILLFFINTAHAGYMEVTLLGTGTPRPSIERFGPATVIEANGRYFVFDSGRGITIRLQQAGIPLSKIEHIFLTHLHSDHISGLSDLWLTSWIWQRQQAIQLTGPTGTAALARHLELAHQADFSYRTKNTKLSPESFTLLTQEIASEGIVYQQDGIKITAFLVDHYPVEPAYGYRIDSGEQSIVISGDTTYSKNLIKHAKGADLLIHEIAAASSDLLAQNTRLQKVISYHTTPEQAVQIFKAVQPKAAIYTHVLLFGVDKQTVIESTRAGFDGDVRMGYDLMKIGVGDAVTFY
jgi:ribonuclease Z